MVGFGDRLDFSAGSRDKSMATHGDSKMGGKPKVTVKTGDRKDGPKQSTPSLTAGSLTGSKRPPSKRLREESSNRKLSLISSLYSESLLCADEGMNLLSDEDRLNLLSEEDQLPRTYGIV